MNIAISSGHGKIVRGAEGYLDEVDEARRVVNAVAAIFDREGHSAKAFHDDVSTSQNENLNRIVDFHNAQQRELDVSVHFNAYNTTASPMGTECLFVTQQELAGKIAKAISQEGRLINRGPKKRDDLFFLNNTDEPAVLIEVCFVDSKADADLYEQHFDAICSAIYTALTGYEVSAEPKPPPTTTEPPPAQQVTVTISVEPKDVKVIIK
jgi:N-acetylmuramoyl-L-alanine amidase